MSYNYSNPSTTIKEFLNFTRGDYTGLAEYLLSCDFATLFQSSDAEGIWHIWVTPYYLAWIYLFLRSGYILVNFLIGLILSYVIPWSVSVHCNVNTISSPHPVTLTVWLMLKTPFRLLVLQQNLHMSRVWYIIMPPLRTQGYFVTSKSLPSLMFFPPNCILTPQQLFQILTKLSYLMNTFILFLHIAILLYQSCLTSQFPAPTLILFALQNNKY